MRIMKSLLEVVVLARMITGVEGFGVRERMKEMIGIGKRVGRGRATEVVKKKELRRHEVVVIERALYEIGFRVLRVRSKERWQRVKGAVREMDEIAKG